MAAMNFGIFCDFFACPTLSIIFDKLNSLTFDITSKLDYIRSYRKKVPPHGLSAHSRSQFHQHFKYK